jgi:hypothetical protein
MYLSYILGNRRGRDRMVVGFTTTYAFITNVVSSNPAHREVYLIQHYVIRFYGVKRHCQQYFSYIVVVSFIGGGNRSIRRKQPTYCK